MNKERKKAKSKLSVLVLLFFSSIISAQSVIIEIKSDSLYINSKKVTKEITLQNLRSLLGNPNREFYKSSTIWTYDSLGLKIYIGKQDSLLETISLDFKKDDFEVSPRKQFNGKLIINSQAVSAKTSIKELEKMEIGLESSNLDWRNASTEYLRLLFDYSKDKKKLEVVEISFK